MCCGENINLPYIIEEKDKTVIIYSNEKVSECEDDEGVKICYSKTGEVVKIVIPKDENYYIIDL